MTDAMIARRYAAALFALGREQGEEALGRYNEDLQALDGQLQAAPAPRVYLSHPSCDRTITEHLVEGPQTRFLRLST